MGARVFALFSSSHSLPHRVVFNIAGASLIIIVPVHVAIFNKAACVLCKSQTIVGIVRLGHDFLIVEEQGVVFLRHGVVVGEVGPLGGEDCVGTVGAS